VNIVVVNLVLVGDGKEDSTWAYTPKLKSAEKSGIAAIKNEREKLNPHAKSSRSSLDEGTFSGLQRVLSNTSQTSHLDRRATPATTPTDINAEIDDQNKSKKEKVRDYFQMPPSRRNSPRTPPPSVSGSAKQTPSKPEKPLEPKSVRWLTDHDMLCKAIPESRVFQFGYRLGLNTKLTADFYDCMAKELLEKIYTSEDSLLKHPIIFVAYGDGGFVVEKALVLAADSNDPRVYQLTAGVVFLGTPFEYSKDFINVFAEHLTTKDRSSGESLLGEEFLANKADTLAELSRTFKSVAQRQLTAAYRRAPMSSRPKVAGFPIWSFQPSDLVIYNVQPDSRKLTAIVED